MSACLLSVKKEATYVAAFLAKMMRFPLALLVIYSVWQSIHSNASGMELTLREILVYYTLVSFLRVCEGTFIYSLPYQVYEDVRSGDLASFLSRPIWYPLYIMSIEVGKLLVFCCSGIPLLMVILTIFLKALDPRGMLLFLASSLIGLTISMLMSLLIGLLSFWTGRVFGIRDLIMSMSLLTSGMLIPIRYLPQWLQRLVRMLPFGQVYSAPIAVYLGDSSIQVICTQFVWIAVLLVAIALVWSIGCRRFEAQGG